MDCSCGSLPDRWWLDKETLERVVRAHGGHSAAAVAHPSVRANTLSHRWGVFGLPKLTPGPKAGHVNEDEVTLDADKLEDIESLLRARGLDPDDWMIIRVLVNTWEGFIKTKALEAERVPLRQLKVTLRPRLDALLKPAAVVAAIRPPKKPSRYKPRLVVFVGDEQAPYHDPVLHRLFLRWLAHNTPSEAVHLGDLLDLPSLSRHRTNPLWNASVQECIQAGYEILRGYREASPDTFWHALPGNHDERIRDYQLQRAPEMFGVRPADLDERELAAVHALPTLLHLAALGIDWRGTDADYEHAQVDVSADLVARHGWITGAGSAEKTVRRLGLNVVVGHTHRQRVHHVTENRRRETLTSVCVEAGCMCTIEGGLGYVINPDWQNGAYAATVWPDGSFNGEHITYRDGVLSWRDQRYEEKS